MSSYLCRLHVMCFAGPSKTVILFDDDGTEEELIFDSRHTFELWAATNTIKQSLEDGSKMFIMRWEQLQDGGRYHTTMTLEKRVRKGATAWQGN